MIKVLKNFVVLFIIYESEVFYSTGNFRKIDFKSSVENYLFFCDLKKNAMKNKE